MRHENHIDTVRAFKRERNPETPLGQQLRGYLRGELTEGQIQTFATLLDGYVKDLARKCTALQAADQQDVAQNVLRELLAGGLRRSRHLRILARRNQSTAALLTMLRVWVRQRLAGQGIDLVRRQKARRVVPLKEAPESSLVFEPSNSPPFPCGHDVHAALQEIGRGHKVRRRDAALVRAMIENEMDFKTTAKARGISSKTVHRAVARMRPLLRAKFEMEP